MGFPERGILGCRKGDFGGTRFEREVTRFPGFGWEIGVNVLVDSSVTIKPNQSLTNMRV